MDRTILHCDMNSFYASVELLEHPELDGKPVAVCGDPHSRHGIILAKNEEAKKYKVQTAETIWQARRKCPDLILLAAHHYKYERFSKIINAIYLRYTDLVEPFSIDESWLDVTGSLSKFGMTGKEIADEIRETVKAETGLRQSVGVSFNKIFAKMGSDYKKPDATTVITRENYKDILWPLPARDLIFVGKSTAAKLEGLNIRTIGAIAQADPSMLHRVFGKHGDEMYRYANGLEDSLVARYDAAREYKSVGNGITFRRNLQGREDVRTAVVSLSDRVSVRLRKHGLRASGVKVDIKDPNLRTISRQMQLESSTNSSAEIAKAAMELIDRNWRYTDPIRLITVTGINISEGMPEEQISLFEPVLEEKRKQNEAIDAAMDSIRDKFGKYSIMHGGALGNDMGISYKESEEEEIEYEER
ncbi:MAG: DNA polymerase IV [Firmicutes bacterium]|nr:DNA polymerase IV [Bacillota bacterium]MBR3718617.1 DNA polymerase IV [Bacillota bacterium]